MFKSIFGVLVMTVLSSTALASCRTPTANDLKSFFQGNNKWGKLGASININFNSPLKSQLRSLKGNDRIKELKLCGNNVLEIKTQKGLTGSVTIKNNKLVIQSKSGNHTLKRVNFSEFEAQSAIVRKSFNPDFYRNSIQRRQNGRQPASSNGIDI